MKRTAPTNTILLVLLSVAGCPRAPDLSVGSDDANSPGDGAAPAADGTRAALVEPAPQAVAGRVTLLNEVRFAPAEGESAFVELKLGADAGGVSALSLENDAGAVYELPDDLPSLASGGFLLIMFDGRSGLADGVLHAAPSDFLNLASGRVRLLDAGQSEQDAVAWGADRTDSVRLGNGGAIADFPPGATISRAPASTTPADPDAWYVTEPPLSTPGSANRLPGVEMLLPIHGALLESGQQSLSWYPARNAESYLVQVARDAQFTQLVLEQTVSSPGVTATLTPGEYFWRVQAMLPGDTKADFSPVCRLTVAESYDAFFADAESKAGQRSQQLTRVVPLYAQRKDTYMLHLEAEHADGPHAWNAPHAQDGSRWNCTADAFNCGLASTSMVNGFFASADSTRPYLSQDRIGLEIYTTAPNLQPGPERDLDSGQGTSVKQQGVALRFALGVTPTVHGPYEGLTDQEIRQYRNRSDLQDAFRNRFLDDLRASIAADRPVLMWIEQPGGSFSHAVVAVRWASTKPRGDVWIGINDPWEPRFYWAPLRSLRIGVYWMIPEGATPTADNPQYVSPPGGDNDDDSDGISNFDEIIRFETQPKLADTDRDCLDDLDEIRASVFNGKHGWAAYVLRRGFSDGKARKTGRPELIVDSDNGGVPDFLEIGDLQDLFNPFTLKDIYDPGDDRLTLRGMYHIQKVVNRLFSDGGESYIDENAMVEFTVHAVPSDDPRQGGKLEGTAHIHWTDEGWYRRGSGDGPCRQVQVYSPPQEWDADTTGVISCYGPPSGAAPGVAFFLRIPRSPGADTAKWHEVCEGYFHDQVSLGGFGTFVYGFTFTATPPGHAELYITRDNLREGRFQYHVTDRSVPGSNDDMSFTRQVMDVTIER